MTPPGEAVSGPPGDCAAIAPATILIIEDDAVTRQQFEEILVSANYSVVAVADCAGALAQLDAHRPAAVLLDLHLPGAGGLECLRSIRAAPAYAHIPVVVITGDYFMDESVSRELASLGARIQFKPVWGDELLELTRELLSGAPSAPPRRGS